MVLLPGFASLLIHTGKKRMGGNPGDTNGYHTARVVAQQAAIGDSNLLIIGEPGTEKEELALAVHNASPRATAPFIEINCVDASDSLLTDALFGQPESERRQYLAGITSLGTIFIDDVEELPLAAQARLMRAFQSGVLRLDSGEEIAFNCRVVAATSVDLIPLVEDRQFRQDFYDTIHHAAVYIPPLRHRKEDIPLLAERFIKDTASRLHKPLKSISDQAMHSLVHYTWPGNLYELRSVIERSAALAKGEVILLDHLPKNVQEARKGKGEGPADDKVLALADIEKRHIQKVLDYTGWHKVRTAQILGIDRSTLYDKIKRYNLAEPAERILEPLKTEVGN